MGPNNGPTYQGYYNGYGQPAPKKFLNKKILLIGGILAVIIIIIIGIVNVAIAGDNLQTQGAHLSARLTNLGALSDDAEKNLTNDDMKKINAEVGIITSGAEGQLASFFPKKIDKKIVTEEADTTSADKLTAAGLAGNYDTEYKDVLGTRLESVDALLGEMYGKASSSADKSRINQSYKDFAALLARLNTINP